jgi:uncharacterized glyoxalase superfamily protein PhnB
MATSPIPKGYHTVTPYLTVRGVKGVLAFVKDALGAEEIYRMEDERGEVRHAEVQIGDSRVMMGEAGDQWPPMPASLYMYVKDVDAVYASAVKAGGVSLREPRDEFYGDRTSGVRDGAGNQWWFATRKEDLTPEQIDQRMAEMKAKAGSGP